MKWKKHSSRIVLISFSIITSFLAFSSDTAESAEQHEAKKLASIESVVPTGDGSATELTIKLTSPSTFTSYKTTSPLRLIIDLSQVTQGNISAPVVVNKGNFKTVTASRFDTDAGVLTRLEIELVNDREALISALPANPGELKISFPASSDTSTTDVKKDLVSQPNVVTEPLSVATNQASGSGNGVSLRSLTAISVNNNTVTLALDGAISDFKTFRLNKPERFVVDLMNVTSGLSTRILPLNASGVASARIGLYPDKVRVVLDSVNGSFPEATAVKTDAGVVITLDEKPFAGNVHTKLTATRVGKAEEVNTISNEKITSEPSLKDEMKSGAKSDVLPEFKPEAKPEATKQAVYERTEPQNSIVSKKNSGASAIEMIDFQVIDGISRVSIKVNGNVKAERPIKTPGYVSVTIKNATLPKNLQRSLETRSFVSPVLRITPLSVKTKKGHDAKIRISTRVAAPFEFRQEGDMLYVDFKHADGLTADKLAIEATEPKFRVAPTKMAVRDEEISSDLSPVGDATVKQLDSSRSYKGRKVTLEFADAEVRKIFQLLAEVSNKNFVLGDEVTGAISLKLVNVPWDQALDIILDTKGLDKREDGNIILIKGKGKFKSQAEEDLEIKKTQAKSIELKTETFVVNYAQIVDITAQFEKIKTPDRGQISFDARTNKVIVKDTPQAINEMRKLLSQLDVSERQVLIEARIVVASSDFANKLGVQWGTHYRDASASVLSLNSVDSGFGGTRFQPHQQVALPTQLEWQPECHLVPLPVMYNLI